MNEALERIIKDRDHLDKEIKSKTREMGTLYSQILCIWEHLEKKKRLANEYTEIIESVMK